MVLESSTGDLPRPPKSVNIYRHLIPSLHTPENVPTQPLVTSQTPVRQSVLLLSRSELKEVDIYSYYHERSPTDTSKDFTTNGIRDMDRTGLMV